MSHYLAGSDGVKKLVSGGDPMFLNSPITLCGRVDLNADRFFDGRLAELSIFDNALTRPQVASAVSDAQQCAVLHAHHVPRTQLSCGLTWEAQGSDTLISARLGGKGFANACRWRTSTPRVLLGCKTSLCQVSCNAQGLNISPLFSADMYNGHQCTAVQLAWANTS